MRVVVVPTRLKLGLYHQHFLACSVTHKKKQIKRVGVKKFDKELDGLREC